MNLDERDLFAVPADPTRPERTPRKCYRHDWIPPRAGHDEATFCIRCGRERDDARARLGRNNRKRGGAEELVIARKLGGQKVGPLGLPHDVVVPGYLRVQVKKLAGWPSLTKVVEWLDAMQPGRDIRAVSVTLAGHNARRVLIVDLDEFAAWHAWEEKGEGAP